MPLEQITSRLTHLFKGVAPGTNGPGAEDASQEDTSSQESVASRILEATTRVEAKDFPEKPPMVNGLNAQQMQQWKVLPIDVKDDAVVVAMADPLDAYLIELLEDIYQRRVEPVLADEEDILSAIYRWYEADSDMEAED